MTHDSKGSDVQSPTHVEVLGMVTRLQQRILHEKIRTGWPGTVTQGQVSEVLELVRGVLIRATQLESPVDNWTGWTRPSPSEEQIKSLQAEVDRWARKNRVLENRVRHAIDVLAGVFGIPEINQAREAARVEPLPDVAPRNPAK